MEEFSTTSGVTEDACAAPPSCDFTLIKNNHGFLTKQIKPGDTGGFVSTPAANLFDGEARRVSVPADESAPKAIAEVIRKIGPSMALVSGSYLGGDQAPVVSDVRRASIPGAISRTKTMLFHAAGKPALLALDVDKGQFPPHIQQRIAQAGDIDNVLEKVMPGFAACGRVLRSSTSTGIYNTATGEEYDGGGLHIYFVVLDGGDVGGFIKRLHQRLIIAGFGYPFISKVGAVYIRSILDTAASGRPEHLFFEADAVLEPPLAYRPGVRDPVVRRGSLVDSPAVCPALSPEELSRYDAEVRSLRASGETDEAKQRRKQAVEVCAESRKAFGLNAAAADTVKLGDGQTPHVLYDDHQIKLDTGDVVSVLDIIREPSRYHEVTCADPLEWDYGGGRNKAVIYTRRHPEIFSHAHGGQTFSLRLRASGLATLVKEMGGSHA